MYSNIANASNNNQYNGLVDIETSMPLIIFPIKVDNNVIGVFEVINAKGI
jgi:hypothetical protein